MIIFIHLPCKPVVKQYLINNYGFNYSIPDGDLVKCIMDQLLQRNSTEQDTKITLQYYSEVAKIPISYKRFELYGNELSKTSIRAINRTIEHIIHQRLYDFLEYQVHVVGLQLNTAIELFQQVYCFPPEIYTHDAIKKHYQRIIRPRVHITLSKFASVNVPIKTYGTIRKKRQQSSQ